MDDMNSKITFVFDDSGNAHAVKQGHIIASASSIDELETVLRNPRQAVWGDSYFENIPLVDTINDFFGDPRSDEEKKLQQQYEQQMEAQGGQAGLDKAIQKEDQAIIDSYNDPKVKTMDQAEKSLNDAQDAAVKGYGGADAIDKKLNEEQQNILRDNKMNTLDDAQKSEDKSYQQAVKQQGGEQAVDKKVQDQDATTKEQVAKQPVTPTTDTTKPPPAAGGAGAGGAGAGKGQQAVKSNPNPYLNAGPYVANGASGDYVTALQNQLNKAGAKLKTDGQFGDQTRQALMDYQKKNKLAVDGVVGDQTARSLNGDPNAYKLKPGAMNWGNQKATHVITPNGLKGRILGKTKDIWGDTVTVRFENGRIVQFPVSENMKFAYEEDRQISLTASLQARLEQIVPGDRNSLLARIDVLKSIKREAQSKMANQNPSQEDERKLDAIVVEANVELAEIVDALEHIASETTEPYAAPAHRVVEQASLGSHTGTWLDDTFAEMVREANGTDYDKLMDEGPEAFVAELDAPALADSGVTREMASNFIRSKTAGANPDARNNFEKTWIDRVESLRRNELLSRKTKVKKEAAAQEDTSHLPDDILFG